MQISNNTLVKIALIIFAITILFCTTSCGNNNKKAKKIDIEITVTEDEHWTETSTPAIVQIKGKSKAGEKVNFYHAVNYDKAKSKIKLDEGKYEVDAITPINNDGSLYKVSKDYNQGDKECTVELEYVASENVPDEQFNKTKEQIEKALKNGDKTIDKKTAKNIKKNLKTAQNNREKFKNDKQNSEKLKQESMEAYRQFIVAAEEGPYGLPLKGYYLIDFADRGVYDLVAEYKDSEASSMNSIFRYNGQSLEKIGEYMVGHRSYAKGKDGRPYMVYAHMGSFLISRINTDLSQEEVTSYTSDSTDTNYDRFHKYVDKAKNDIFGSSGQEIYYEYYDVEDLSPFN